MDVKPITAEGTLPALVAGVLTGVVVLLGALSQAAFLFSGPLEAGLPMAVGAALFAAAVTLPPTVVRANFTCISKTAMISNTPAMIAHAPVSPAGIGDSVGTVK